VRCGSPGAGLIPGVGALGTDGVVEGFRVKRRRGVGGEQGSSRWSRLDRRVLLSVARIAYVGLFYL
jgi:hypothetical protein